MSVNLFIALRTQGSNQTIRRKTEPSRVALKDMFLHAMFCVEGRDVQKRTQGLFSFCGDY
jgi:hypothetical protein